MKKEYVINLLKQAKKMNIDVYITGGWGIDALLGYQTRQHEDIDIFIDIKNYDRFLGYLVKDGFYLVEREYSAFDQLIFVSDEKGEIDLHLLEFIDEEIVSFKGLAYPLSVFDANGIIGDVTIRCLTPEAQVMYHLGYELKEKDIKDVENLCKHFDLVVPDEFKI